jgi:MoaD family protein
MIEITILGFFQDYIGKKHIAIDKPERPVTIREILETLSTELKKYIEKHPEHSIILVNGKSIYNLKNLDTEIKDGDKISIMPVVGGGTLPT